MMDLLVGAVSEMFVYLIISVFGPTDPQPPFDGLSLEYITCFPFFFPFFLFLFFFFLPISYD